MHFCTVWVHPQFHSLYLSCSSTVMWHFLDNPDSTLVKPMSLLVLAVETSSAHNMNSFSCLSYHSASHCGPVICHWNYLHQGGLPSVSCWLLLNWVLAAEKGKHPFMALVSLYSFPAKALWCFLSFACMPRLYFVPAAPSVSLPFDAQDVVIFVILSKEEKCCLPGLDFTSYQICKRPPTKVM